MTIGLVASLAGLALVDSTSFGTLGVPIFLIGAGTAGRRVLLYLATITLFYFAVGLGLLLGADAAWQALRGALAGVLAAETWLWLQVGVGVALVVISYLIDPKYRQSAPKRSWAPRDSSPRATVLLALGAGAVEVATMLPYLGAIALLVRSDLGAGERVGLLVAYTAVMALPALVLLGLAISMRRWFGPWLDRVGGWIEKNAGVGVAWGVGIVGFLVAADGLQRLVPRLFA